MKLRGHDPTIWPDWMVPQSVTPREIVAKIDKSKYLVWEDAMIENETVTLFGEEWHVRARPQMDVGATETKKVTKTPWWANWLPFGLEKHFEYTKTKRAPKQEYIAELHRVNPTGEVDFLPNTPAEKS